MKLWNVLLSAYICFAAVTLGATTPSSASDRFDTNIASLAKDISEHSRQTGVIKIAILGFSGNDNQTNAFGKMLAEELTAKLFQSRKYQIIERELLVKVLKEQKFELTGPVDPAAIQRLGKLLSIDAILTGSISDTAVGLRINARLISTTSGEVLSVGSTTIAKDAFVSSFLRMSFEDVGNDQQGGSREGRLDTLIKQHGFIFECKRFYVMVNRPESIYVDVAITNLGPDTELTLGDHMRSGYSRGATKIITRAGNEFPIYDIFVGREQSKQNVLFGNYRHSGIRQRFPSKLPITVTFNFTARNAREETPVALDLLTSSFGTEHDELLLHLRVPQQK